jgi:predicted nucleotidyltransferase
LNIPKMGFIIPNMGTKRPAARKARTPLTALGIADALFSKVQRRVLGVLFGNPGRTYFANEVIALAESGTGAVQRELTRLAAAGLVTVKSIGKQKHYQANPASPVFAELRGLMVKTSGIADVVRDALEPVAKRVDAAFVYGSVAKGEDTATSDIDLMVVSDSLTYADIFGRLEEASERLGRRVNPTVYSPRELSKRIKQDNAFVTRVLQQPKLWLIGEQRAISGA